VVGASRIEADKLAMTQEFLALMLGVRRGGVTTALQQLENKGLVKRMRGAVTVKDRDGVRECAMASMVHPRLNSSGCLDKPAFQDLADQ
jgi:Mn-dependent DtxR family transcriptional regulator